MNLLLLLLSLLIYKFNYLSHSGYFIKLRKAAHITNQPGMFF